MNYIMCVSYNIHIYMRHSCVLRPSFVLDTISIVWRESRIVHGIYKTLDDSVIAGL